MIYLLDTNVVSAVMKPVPNRAVMRWIDSVPEEQPWICTVVVAEVLSGLDLMPTGRRQNLLRENADFMFSVIFKNRILSFDRTAAKAFGPILRERKRNGRPIDSMDALIAGIAATHSPRRPCRASACCGCRRPVPILRAPFRLRAAETAGRPAPV